MIIGALGDIVFRVSPWQVRTFKNMQRTRSARYATHNRHMKKPLIEMVGLDADKITFTVTLCESLGVRPDDDLLVLNEMIQNGEYALLTFGNRLYGRGVVQSIQETYVRHNKNGSPSEVNVNITFLESPKR